MSPGPTVACTTGGSWLRHGVQFVVGIGLAVFLLWWGLPTVAHTTWTAVWALLSQLQSSTVLGLTVLMISGLWLVTFLYTGSLKGLTHFQAMIVNAAGSSIGNLLPGGGAAGVVEGHDPASRVPVGVGRERYRRGARPEIL